MYRSIPTRARTRYNHQMQVRRAESRDCSALLKMMVDFNQIEGIAFDRAATEPALRRLIADETLGCVAIAEDAGVPIGYAVVTWSYDLEWNGRDAFVTEIYLVSDARGRRLGATLLAAVEALAREAGARALHLLVLPENARALALYRRAGFESQPRVMLTKPI
jgi:ribosomal protein S18 acetylase RimI-like enzyme